MSGHLPLARLWLSVATMLFAGDAWGDFFVSKQTGGSLGYAYRQNTSSGGAEYRANQLMLRLTNNAYIWQPWAMTSSADFVLTQSYSDNDTSSNEAGVLTGTVQLNVLPMSRIPLSVAYTSSDARTDTTLRDQNATERDLANWSRYQRLTVQQSYFGNLFRANVRYGLEEAQNDNGNNSQTETWAADYSWRTRYQAIKATAVRTDSSVEGYLDDKDTLTLTATHRYFPAPTLTVDTLWSYVDFNEQRQDLANPATPTYSMATRINQVSSGASWRSDNGQTTVRANLRAMDLSHEYLASSSERQGVYSTINTRHRYNQNLSVTAGLSLNVEETGQGERTSASGQSLGVTYAGDPIRFGNGSYSWATSVNASRSDNGEEEEILYGGSAQHGMNYSWTLGRRDRLTLNLSQSLNQTSSGAGQTASMLGHGVNLSWIGSSNAAQTSAVASFSDTRDLAGEQSESQMLNIQLARRQSLSRRASLNGSVSYQASRRYTPGEDNPGVTQASSASASYSYMRPFGLHRLSFTSRLKASETRPGIGDERSEWLWESRLDHVIGKLKTSLSFNMQSVDGYTGNSLLFRLQRSF